MTKKEKVFWFCWIAFMFICAMSYSAIEYYEGEQEADTIAELRADVDIMQERLRALEGEGK